MRNPLIRNLDLTIIGLAFIGILIFFVPDDAPVRNGILTQTLSIVFICTILLAIGAYASRKIFPEGRPHYFIIDKSNNEITRYEATPDYWRACLLRLAVIALPFSLAIAVLIGTG